MTPTAPTVADVLRGAAQKIRTDGWFGKGAPFLPESSCVMLAISHASGNLADVSGISALAFAHEQAGGNVYHWNDHVCRDGLEAAESLEKWAARWEETA